MCKWEFEIIPPLANSEHKRNIIYTFPSIISEISPRGHINPWRKSLASESRNANIKTNIPGSLEPPWREINRHYSRTDVTKKIHHRFTLFDINGYPKPVRYKNLCCLLWYLTWSGIMATYIKDALIEYSILCEALSVRFFWHTLMLYE